MEILSAILYFFIIYFSIGLIGAFIHVFIYHHGINDVFAYELESLKLVYEKYKKQEVLDYYHLVRHIQNKVGNNVMFLGYCIRCLILPYTPFLLIINSIIFEKWKKNANKK